MTQSLKDVNTIIANNLKYNTYGVARAARVTTIAYLTHLDSALTAAEELVADIEQLSVWDIPKRDELVTDELGLGPHLRHHADITFRAMNAVYGPGDRDAGIRNHSVAVLEDSDDDSTLILTQDAAIVALYETCPYNVDSPTAIRSIRAMKGKLLELWITILNKQGSNNRAMDLYVTNALAIIDGFQSLWSNDDILEYVALERLLIDHIATSYCK